jgi:hypothetical protein
MRQRALVIVEPNPIAHVDIAAGERAFTEVLGLAQSRSGDLFAHAASRGRGSSIGMIAVMCTPHKKSARFPEADPYTARGVHPAALPSWCNIVTAIGAVKPLTVATV